MKPLHIAITMLIVPGLWFSSLIQAQSGDARQNRGRIPHSANQMIRQQTRMESGDSLQVVTKSRYSAREQVMVIPLQDINPATYGEMQEDMKVMARILDNCLTQNTRGKPQIGDGLLDFGDFFTDGRAAETLYLEGYGVLFLMSVDFPLSPVPQSSPSSEDVNSPHDTTWERAKEDVLSPTSGAMTSATDPSIRFDAKQIEAIKRELIRSLKYASHIRHLPAAEHLILRLSNVRESGVHEQTRFERRGRNFSLSGSTGGGFGGRSGGRLGSGGGTISSQASSGSPASVLVIRTCKSDVDAFAHGTIDFETFSQRVTIIMH